MIRVILCGATGRMGCEIKTQIDRRDEFIISYAVDTTLSTSFSDFMGEADVVIDFSVPAVLSEELSFCVQRKLPLVLGTTGHSESAYAAIERAAEQIAIIKSENFSKGAYVLGKLAQIASKMLGDAYDASIVEAHHRKKKDAPSGTAKRIATMMDSPVQMHSIRGGEVVGTHDVYFLGSKDRLVLSHEAFDRGVFANGALDASKWIIDCAPGLYGMSDFAKG